MSLHAPIVPSSRRSRPASRLLSLCTLVGVLGASTTPAWAAEPVALVHPEMGSAELDILCAERDGAEANTASEAANADLEFLEPDPDPTVVEHNKKLAAQTHDAERWVIGGRVGAGLAGLFVVSGVAMLALYGARKRAFEDSALSVVTDPTMLDNPAPLTRPPRVGLAAAGGLMLGAGLAGAGASVWAMLRGANRMKAAREGKLTVNLNRHHAGLSFQGRF